MKSLGTVLAVVIPLLMLQSSVAEDWLRFRGPNGSGVSTSTATTVTEFGDKENLTWKIELPGAGASGPIVVGDKIIVSCYSGYGESRDNVGKMENLKRHVVCVSRTDGKILWQKDLDSYLPEDPFSGMGVPEHGYASSTPVSDGQNVYVFFGKTGVVALDLDGKELWKTSVGTASGQMRWGSGASPIEFGDVVIVNASEEAEALVGLDKKTGKEAWKAKAAGLGGVWGTPVIVGEGDDAQIVISVPYEIWGLNPKNGKLKWYTTNGIQDGSVSASIMVNQDTVIAIGGRSSTAVAVKTGGKDDVTKDNTIWTGRAGGRIVTPLVYDGHIYSFGGGIATCLDAYTGKEVYKERLPSTGGGGRQGGGRFGGGGGGTDYASPVLADGKIYQFVKSGTCFVIEAKPEFKLLATNKFDDNSGFNATPAISNGQLVVRSNKYLYCIGEEQK